MPEHRKAVIGSDSNFWLYHSETGYDLTHPPTQDGPLVLPRVPLETTAARVTLDPAKSALVVIDMQNFFISPCLGRPNDGKGIQACNQLLEYAIPACRKAGIRIIWLNWGLTQQEIDEMPPATLRAFGFSTFPDPSKSEGNDNSVEGTASKDISKNVTQKDSRLYQGLGSDLGQAVVEDGSSVEAGRLLMRDQWNSALYTPLEKARQEGLTGKCQREDVWIHKNRMSGLWGSETSCSRYLSEMGIRSLLFAGVNTDQCVGGTLQDAFSKGYDCLLLDDGCGTSSPEHAQECIEFNAGKTWGFVLRCKDLAEGVEKMLN